VAEAPITLCVQPTTIETFLLTLNSAHPRESRIPPITSNTPTDSKANMNSNRYVSFVKAVISITSSRVKTNALIKIIPIIMRKPPMATANLLNFLMRSVNLATVSSKLKRVSRSDPKINRCNT